MVGLMPTNKLDGSTPITWDIFFAHPHDDAVPETTIGSHEMERTFSCRYRGKTIESNHSYFRSYLAPMSELDVKIDLYFRALGEQYYVKCRYDNSF